MSLPPQPGRRCDVLILGAGAAGLMCGIEAARRGSKALVIDHAEKPAEKIRISGGGRCNFTNINATPSQFLSDNPDFCVSALKRVLSGLPPFFTQRSQKWEKDMPCLRSAPNSPKL